MVKSIYKLLILLTISCVTIFSQDIVNVYNVPNTQQGVATDADYFYVINNNHITKHHKSDGVMAKCWKDVDRLLNHMNSGVIIDDKLYVVNSNYPDIPMASSIEVFDPVTLEHLTNHSFGILNGSATWMDQYKGHWYVSFAHYTGRGGQPGHSNGWTRLVKFDSAWRQIESWVFPQTLLEKFVTRSSSGGVILENGTILCTGHDNYELYVLKFPEKGFTLQWIKTIPVGSFGQGIAYEKNDSATLIYGIIKSENKVIVSKINK